MTQSSPQKIASSEIDPPRVRPTIWSAIRFYLFSAFLAGMGAVAAHRGEAWFGLVLGFLSGAIAMGACIEVALVKNGWGE